jgi:MoxR-like ATPase
MLNCLSGSTSSIGKNSFLPVIDKFGQSQGITFEKGKLQIFAKSHNFHAHPQFIDAALNAAKSGIHVLFEGPSGCGLSSLANFVSLYCFESTHSHEESQIPRVLLGQESTVENIIGTFKPQSLSGGDGDITKLFEWEDGPLLKSAKKGIPVIH